MTGESVDVDGWIDAAGYGRTWARDDWRATGGDAV
jgi:hypothetical protein